MAQTKTKTRTKTPTQTRRVATTKKSPATRRHAAAKGGESRFRATVGSTTELSDEVLKSVEDGQRAAIEAVQKFVATVDRALPPRGKGPSRRQEIVDSALEMADRLVHTQYDFLRKVVNSAGKSLSESGRAK
jgi:hypothetical protein